MQTHLVGTSAYTFINNFFSYVNSQTIETITNYKTVVNMLTNVKLSTAQKLGQQYSLGYLSAAPILAVENEEIDGRTCTATSDEFYLSAPLYSLLGNSEKLIPFFFFTTIHENGIYF